MVFLYKSVHMLIDSSTYTNGIKEKKYKSILLLRFADTLGSKFTNKLIDGQYDEHFDRLKISCNNISI